MIPQTFPSVLDSSNRTQMVIYMLPSITGLTKWIDYIPVKSSPGEGDLTLINRYEANGYIYTTTMSDITGKQAWKDYIPVYIDSSANTAWSSDNDGYIPMSGLAALLLDFTTGRLDSRITFSRTSNATVTNSLGTIAYAPHNLLTYSEQFDNAAWTKANATVTANATTAPDGTITADKLVETAAAGSKTIRNITTTVTGITYTYSFYAKAGERNWIIVGQDNSGTGYFWVNLTNGTFGNTSGTYVSRSIIPASNGFYRVSITYVATSTTASGICFLDSTNGGISYTGDGTSGLYIWGAQLEVGTSPTAYNSTTVKNLLGFSELFDNAAWTKSNSFVQTNQLIYSQDFSNAAWVTVGATSKASAPVITYTNTNDSLKQEKSITATSTTFTFSIKLSGSGTISIGLSNTVDDVSRTQITLTATPTRYLITKTFNATASSTVRAEIIRLVTDNATSVTVAEAQLVQGSVAGDYRRTDSAVLPIYYPNHNGVVCAEKFVEGLTTLQQHPFFQSATLTTSIYTFSIYAKSYGGNKRYISLYPQGTGVAAAAIFDIDAGTVIFTSGAQYLSSSITPAGNGYYRCSIKFQGAAVSVANVVYMLTDPANPSAPYVGDGTSGIYIFGAQLSDSASLDTYVLNAAAAPSAAAYYGARFDYDPVTLQPKGLLIEEQRTNLLTYSEQFDNAAWVKSDTTISANAVTSPNNTLTADKFIPANNTNNHFTYQAPTGSAGTYIFTVYAKSGEYNFIALGSNNPAPVYSYFNLSTGVVSSVPAQHTASISNAGNGWYRCSITLTTTNPNTAFIIGVSNVSGSITTAGDGTSGIYIWGAQLEAGSFATSYIPTGASQATRTADVATVNGSNFYSWYNQNEGSIFCNAISYGASSQGSSMFWSINDASLNNRIRYNATGGGYDGYTNNVAQFSIVNSYTYGNYAKVASAYKTNSFNSAINNTLGTEDTSGTTPIVTQMQLGNLITGREISGHIKSIAYYNTRLSDATIKGLTA